MTTNKKVDIAIIGAGSAGMRAYREVSKHTDSVILIEGDQYGTTCARVGCMPSKLLIAAAESAHADTHSAEFGITYIGKKIDGKAVMKRVRFERDRFVGFVKGDVKEWPEEHRIMGYAKFISDNVLQVDDTQIEADRIIIAAGSRPNILPAFKEFGDRLIVNDDIFYWDDLPKSVAVFGAGVIGLELGQALSRLGVRVSLFSHSDNIGSITDPAVRKKAHEVFKDEMAYYPSAKITKRSVSDAGAEIEYIYEGTTHTDTFDYVVCATGRVSNVDKLALENTSLTLNDRGMPSFDVETGQIENSPIFIAGDVNNILPLLHEASDEGTIAAYNAINYPNIARFKKSSHISVVFSDPQIMLVGQTHRELTQSGVEFETGEVDWKSQGRSRVMLINKGLLRVYGEKGTGRFLGAEMVGPRAEHLAHLLAWSHQSNLTVPEMLERPFYHPVVEEGLRTALRDLNSALELNPTLPPRMIKS
jgi:dihydrolipoamide dehydrogenase